MSIANEISLSDLFFLNPQINANCTNLLLGYAYCVEPVGNIATYTGYTKTGGLTITVPPATFSSVNTAIPTTSGDPGYIATTSLLPKASGTVEGCNTYRNYDSKNGLNACSYIAYAYGVTIDRLQAWNPSLSSNLDTCGFQSGYSYCVVQSEQICKLSVKMEWTIVLTEAATVTTPGYCLPVNATEPGTASTCNCFTQVHGYQNRSGKSHDYRSLSVGMMSSANFPIIGYNCDSMTRDFSITIDQLTTWNPWLGSNCNVGLYANLGYSDKRAICIGVNASAPTGSATAPPSASSTPTGTETTASMGPMQTGVVAGCQQFYTVQSGDTCYAIWTTFGISNAQFYEWNPSGMPPVPLTCRPSRGCCITSMILLALPV